METFLCDSCVVRLKNEENQRAGFNTALKPTATAPPLNPCPSIAAPSPLAMTTRQKQRQQINPPTHSHIEQRSEPRRNTEKLLSLR